MHTAMERYDPESGLVFRESVMKAPNRAQDAAWEHRCRPCNTTRQAGMESLYAKAMREVVRNAHLLSTEVLKDLPSTIVIRIWHEIRRQHRESLHLFKTFAGSGRGDRTFLHGTKLCQQAFEKPLVDYILDISSPSFAWMTDLLLEDVSCTAGELKQLSKLGNLRKLQIWKSGRNNPNVYLDDSILDYWAYCARHQGAFSTLEMLVVSNERGISSKSLTCLGHFPGLQTVLFCNTSVKREHANMARQYGWFLEMDGGFLAHRRAQRLKRLYKNSWGTQIDLDDLIRTYSAEGRPENGRYDNQPILGVNFFVAGSGGDDDFRYSNSIFDDAQLLCFERDQSLATRASDREPLEAATTNDHSQTSKRRKLKDGKAVQLGSLLATF